MDGFSKDKITAAANDAAKQLGYESLRELQLKVIEGVVSGNDVLYLLCSRLAIAKVFAMAVYRGSLTLCTAQHSHLLCV